jgi:hypothetical protein
VLKPIIGIVAATLVTPALADEYWVKYDYNTHECSVVQSATHQTETRFPWSAPNDGSKPKDALNGPANGSAGATTDGTTNETGNPNGSTTTAIATNGNAAPNDSNAASGAPNETGASNTSNTTNNSGTTNNTNNGESESPVVAAWKRKAELAKKDKIDVSTALVGSAMQTREQAEEEMQIMRICGLKN